MIRKIFGWFHLAGSTVQEWAESHIGLPIILIAMGLVALVYPKFVMNFFFPVRTDDIKKHSHEVGHERTKN